MEFLGFEILELVILIISLIIAGVFAGLLAGLLGIGGGVILVPVLFQLFTFLNVESNIIMHLSVGTSLAIIVPTSMQSVGSHMAKKAVDIPLLKSWALPVLLGAVTGALIISYIDGSYLKAVFSIIVVIIAIKLLFGKQNWVVRDNMPFGYANNIIAYSMGFFSTLMGIGGGTLGVTYMTLCGRKIHQAIATCSGLGLLISVPATLGFIYAGWGLTNLPFLSAGYVNFLGVLVMIPATVFAAPHGVKLAHSFSRRTLEVIFALLLFTVATRFFISLV